MESKLEKDVSDHLVKCGLPRVLSLWAPPVMGLQLQRAKVDQRIMCQFVESVRLEPSVERGEDSLTVNISLRKLSPAVVGMLRKKFFEYGKGGDSGELTRDFTAIVRRRRVNMNSGIISSEDSDNEFQVGSSCHQSDSEDSVSIRPNNGITNKLKQLSHCHHHHAHQSECGHSLLNGCKCNMTAVKRGKRKRRRKTIELELNSSSDEDTSSFQGNNNRGFSSRQGSISQSVTAEAVHRICSSSGSSNNVSPQLTGGMPRAVTERTSSTEDSGYPHSTCSSERVQEPQSSPSLMQENVFSSSTSPMEFLSPTLLGVHSGHAPPSDHARGDGNETANQEGVWQQGSGLLFGGPGKEREAIIPDFDVLLSNNNAGHESMFEPEDLVIYNKKDCGDDGLNFGLDTAFNAVDLLDKLNEEGVSIDSNFLDLDVQGMCNSMFSLDDQGSAYDRSTAARNQQKDAAYGGMAEANVRDKSKRSALSVPKSKKKRRIEVMAKPPSSGNVPKVLSCKSSQSRFGRKITPSWKIRSQDFNYDEEEEMEYVKMVYAQSKKESENQKWEEIGRTMLQDWQKIGAGEDNLLATPSGLTSLEDLGVDWEFSDQAFTDFINLPVQQLMMDSDRNISGDASLTEKDVDGTMVYRASNAEGKDEGAGGSRGGEGPCWVGRVRVEDTSDNDNDETSHEQHNIVVIVRRKKRTGASLCLSGAGRNGKVRLKEPLVRMVRLKQVPRRSREFYVQQTHSEDIPRVGGRTELESTTASEGDCPVIGNCEARATVAKYSEPHEVIPAAALAEQFDVLTADLDVDPFVASELPAMSVGVSQSLVSAVQSSVSATPVTPSEMEDDIVDVVGVMDEEGVAGSHGVMGVALASSPPEVVAEVSCSNSHSCFSLADNSDIPSSPKCDLGSSSSVSDLHPHSDSLASASSLPATPSIVNSATLTSLTHSSLLSADHKDGCAVISTDADRSVSVPSGIESTSMAGGIITTSPTTICCSTSPTSIFCNTSPICYSHPTPSTCNTSPTSNFCTTNPASISIIPTSISCIVSPTHSVGCTSPTIDTSAPTRECPDISSTLASGSQIKLESTHSTTKQLSKKIIVKSPSSTVRRKKLSLKTTLKNKPKSFKLKESEDSSNTSLCKEGDSHGIVTFKQVKAADGSSNTTTLSSSMCSEISVTPEPVGAPYMDSSQPMSPATPPSPGRGVARAVSAAPESPLPVCSSKEHGVREEEEEQGGVAGDVDEDFIDVHVDDADMFSDVEGDTLEKVFVKQLPSEEPAKSRIDNKSPMPQTVRQRTTRWQTNEREAPPRLSVKDRLGSCKDRSHYNPQVANTESIPTLVSVLGRCGPAHATPPPIDSATTSSTPVLVKSPVHSAKSITFSDPLVSYNDGCSVEPPPLSDSCPPDSMTVLSQPSSSASASQQSVAKSPLTSGLLQSPSIRGTVQQHTSGLNRDGTVPILSQGRLCFNYLMKEQCQFESKCKYLHVDLAAAPLHILEYFVRVRPIGQLSFELVHRYALDSHSASLLKINFKSFITMLLALINSDVGVMAKHWRGLTTSVGVKFNVLLLCRILHLLARNNSHLGSARTLAAELLDDPYQLALDDYLNMVEIFGQERLFEELKRLHYTMTKKGFHPDMLILTEITKYTEDLGDWVFCLFKDILRCASSDQDASCKLALHLLDKVSNKVLSTEPCLHAVLSFLEAFPPFSKRINAALFRRISQALEGSHLWSPLLVFLEHCVHLWSSMPRSSICRPLELAVEQVGVSSTVVRVVELLTKGQRSSLNCQTWEKVIMWCMQHRMAQKASSFYKFISSSNSKLSSEGTIQLAELLQSQNNSCLAMTVLRDGLQRLPPVIPPLALLTDVATSGGVVNTTQELFPVMATLVRRHITPPEQLLDLVLCFISKEKCYSKLSELVRVSMKCNVKMGRAFYDKAAAELEQWGQDPDSARLATILSRGESADQDKDKKRSCGGVASSEGKGRDVERVVCVETSERDNSEEKGEMENGGVRDMDVDSLSGDSLEGGAVTPTQSEVLALPLQSWIKSSSNTVVPAGKLSPVATVGESSCSSIPDFVREPPDQEAPHFRLAQSPPPPVISDAIVERSSGTEVRTTPRTTPPEFLTLIQTNGRMGQYGAVTSILVDLESTASWYDDNLVLSIWDILATSQSQKPAAAFSSFLNHLDRSRSSGLNLAHRGVKSGPGSSLLSSDRWLASQLGIGLIRLHEQKKDWRGGYSVLQTLHFFKIPYVSLSQPPSNLPLLVFSPPTPCGVALAAASLCLRIQNGMASAMEVLSSSNWVEAGGEEEEAQRLELILSVARCGLVSGMLSEVKTCLEKVTASGSLPEKYIPEVNELYNQLLLAVLEKGDCSSAMATVVYDAINNNRLHCRPRTFSLLVKHLCNNNQASRAEEFCLQAIAGSRYAPLFNGSPYEITFPSGLTELEARLLLQHHVKSLSMNSEGGKRNLVLHLATGTQKFFEGVVNSLTPPLTMACRGKDAVISGECLVLWRESNPSSASRQQSEGVAAASGTAKPKPIRVCINRKSKAASEQVLRKQQEGSVRHEFASTMKPYRSRFSCEADYKHVIRLLSASYFKTSQKFHEARQAASTSAQLGVRESWEAPPTSVREEVRQIVTDFVSKFTVYSMEMDRKLGLC